MKHPFEKAKSYIKEGNFCALENMIEVAKKGGKGVESIFLKDGRELLNLIHYTAARGKKNIKEIITYLIEREGFSIDDVNKAGYTPLFTAIEFGNEHAVTALLENGASPNVELTVNETCNDGLSFIKRSLPPLFFALRLGNKNIIKAILSKANPNVQLKNSNESIFHYLIYLVSCGCCTEKAEDIATLLVENNANVMLEDRQGRLPGRYAQELLCEELSKKKKQRRNTYLWSSESDKKYDPRIQHLNLLKKYLESEMNRLLCLEHNFFEKNQREACFDGGAPSKKKKKSKWIDSSQYLEGFFEDIDHKFSVSNIFL